MARCPSCNKFPSLSTDGEPEISSTLETHKDEEGSVTAQISGDVRIVLTSECCGDDMKESTFSVDISDIDLEKAKDCTCEGDSWFEDAEISDESGTITDRTESTKSFTYKRGPLKGQTVQKPIKFRYQRRYYGTEVEFIIHCPCGKEIGKATFQDETQASGMDELT